MAGFEGLIHSLEVLFFQPKGSQRKGGVESWRSGLRILLKIPGIRLCPRQ
jgi:hypothetical protein